MLELSSWENIIHSEDWRYFKKLLEEHKIFLQKEVNDSLRKGSEKEAFGALRALDDCDKIIQLVSTRISNLRQQLGKPKQ